MPSIVLYLALVAFASAAPRLELTAFMPWLEPNDCVDGVNNVIKAADAKPGLPIQFNEIEIWVYDKDGKPSCHNGRAALTAPGRVKAVKGIVTVTTPTNLKSSSNVKFTVQKADLGTLCNYGKATMRMIPDNKCNKELSAFIPEKLHKLFSTPGTYDFVEMAKAMGLPTTFDIPRIDVPIREKATGDWQSTAFLFSNNNEVAALKLPSNTEWLYIN